MVAAVGGCIVCVALIALLLCVVKKRGGDNGANTAECGDLDEYRDVPSDIYGTAPNWRDDDDGLVECNINVYIFHSNCFKLYFLHYKHI